jgi:hypothetical protein
MTVNLSVGTKYATTVARGHRLNLYFTGKGKCFSSGNEFNATGRQIKEIVYRRVVCQINLPKSF